MKKSSFQYIFRFCCDPGFHESREIKALLSYVEEADIDDVAVFANVEELNTGHMSFAEQDVYLSMMEKIKDLLAEKGVTMSVNQWHSVMHADLGKELRQDQHFRLMVDYTGQQAKLCVCPLCENWQAYIADLYARYAVLEPSILWVEDDFRLHNHDPLVWGGCFCDEHMKLYSERAGKKLTREEFLEGVLRPGKVHPYRKIWLDVSRETLESAAKNIAAAVRKVSGQTKIGLMSSVPQIHAAEGRNWHTLLRTLASGTTPVDRIHLPGYQETSPSHYLHNLNMVSMLTRAMLPPETLVYPELENYPFSLFSKSLRFTRFQLLSSLPLQVAGITLDLYDLNGNGIVWEDGYQRMLHRTKPFLNAVSETGVFAGKPAGVSVLYSSNSSYTLHTREGTSMEELYPQEVFFAALLPAMGVPYTYTDDPDLHGQIAAVSGQVLRNYDAETITRLFADNFVLLNADAVFTLCELGLGFLAGIKRVRWMRQNGGEYAYEQVTNGKVYQGRENARASAILSCSDVLDVTYEPQAHVKEYTAFYDSCRRRRAHGQVVVEDHVWIYPFGNFDGPLSVPPMLLNSLRRELTQEILRGAKPDFPLVCGASYLEPYCFVQDKRMGIYLVNGSTDDLSAVELALPFKGEYDTLSIWRSENEDVCVQEVPSEASDTGLKLSVGLSAMESMLILLPLPESGEVEEKIYP